jgi:hypothetical protein
MKSLSKITLLVIVLAATFVHATSITVGSMDSGNCYPFTCNDSGTNSGVSVDLQEVYNSSAFSGPITVGAISYSYWPFGGPSVLLGGTYAFYWGYSAVGLGLTSNLPSNYNGNSNLFFIDIVPAGGVNFGSSLLFNGFTPFTYDPNQGDLIIEVVAVDQDNVPNNGLNGYNWADYTGADVMRAYCLTNTGCTQSVEGALVTTFTSVPEPGTMVLFGSGALGLMGLLRRKLML